MPVLQDLNIGGRFGMDYLASGNDKEPAMPNKSVNGTPNCYAVWFPPLRSGARYVQR